MQSIHRRKFISSLSAGMLAMAANKSSSQAQKKPNFIILFADDLGYGDIEGFGTQPLPYETPHLRQMAGEGVRLTNVHVPTPYCAPSRATLLTGRYPFRNTMVFNTSPDIGVNDPGLPPSEITIAEALKPLGYATSCIGKWHLGHKPEFLPRQQGFDEYFGILYSNDMRPVQLVENEEVSEYPVVQSDLTKRYTKRAVDFIERSVKDDKPFFLYLPHAMPHKPLAASENFYTPDTPDDLYADVIRELDWSVGEILSTVKRMGVDENTMIIFTSDNGPWYGGSTGGLRGMKGSNWEGGLRVPFIARWKGTLPEGIANDSLAGTINILPTLLNRAGAEMPDDRIIDGKDMWDMLNSSDAPSPNEAIISMNGINLMTVQNNRWKLHVCNPGKPAERSDDWIDPRGPDGVTLIAPYEQSRPSAYPGLLSGDQPQAMILFDLHHDPAEQHDVSHENPEIVNGLKSFYDRMLQDVPEFQQPSRFPSLRRVTGGTMDFYLTE